MIDRLTAFARARPLWVILAVAFVLLAAGMGLRDPWPSDEPRFTLVARQMIESGDWWFPRRGIDLYSDKPPMLMWLEALSYLIVGEWRIAFLLPSLLAALLTLALTYDLARRLHDARAAAYATVAVLATTMFTFQMKRAQIDPLVTCFITFANWGILRHLLLGPDWRAFWLGCAFAGLGVITKGVGVIALLMLIPYAVLRARGWPGVVRTDRSGGRWALGALAFLAPILAWMVPMVLEARARGTAEYAHYVNDILFRQTATRYADSWSHEQPPWYYVSVLLFQWLPFSLAYFGLVPRWRDAFRARDAKVLLPLLWALLVVVFFSIPVGKREVYILPALPMVALAAAPFLPAIVAARWFRVAAFALALVGGLVAIGAGGAALLGMVEKARLYAVERELPDGGAQAWWLVVAIGAGFVAAALAFRARRGVHALLAGLAAMWLAFSFVGYPILNDSNSAAGVMRRARAMVGPEVTLGLVGWREQNGLMAVGPWTDFGFKRPLDVQLAAGSRWLREDPTNRRLFVEHKGLGDCIDAERLEFAGYANRRRWWLLGAEALRGECHAQPSQPSPPS